MSEIERAIQHFESLQKRYTTQHNGKHCELVGAALQALRAQAERENMSNPFLKCKDCANSQTGYFTDKRLYCSVSGRMIEVDPSDTCKYKIKKGGDIS